MVESSGVDVVDMADESESGGRELVRCRLIWDNAPVDFRTTRRSRDIFLTFTHSLQLRCCGISRDGW